MPCSPKDLARISTRWHEYAFIWYETARLARRRALQVGDVAVDGPGVAHDKSRHESKYRVVDLAFLGDGELRSIAVPRDLINPTTAERQRWIGDAVHKSLPRHHAVRLEQNGAVRSDLFEAGAAIVGR